MLTYVSSPYRQCHSHSARDEALVFEDVATACVLNTSLENSEVFRSGFLAPSSGHHKHSW